MYTGSMGEVGMLLLFVVGTQLVGFASSFFNLASLNTWYTQINKPVFTPPNSIFGPVWILLYFLMGISAYLVWSEGWKKKRTKRALGVYGVQLFLNFIWSYLFFGIQNPLLAFIEIILLWVFIVLTIVLFYRVKKIAGLILIPYLLWVSFAAILNLSVYLLNR